jgi:hypothetical protein
VNASSSSRHPSPIATTPPGFWPWLLTLLLATASTFAGDLALRTQLVWGTDGERPVDVTVKELDSQLKKKLGSIFKWKNYFEVNQQKITLGPKESKKLKLSNKCEIELRFLDDNTLEIKLFGEGKLTKTVRQSVKSLVLGDIAVLAGDDKDKYNDAWFVILSVPPA